MRYNRSLYATGVTSADAVANTQIPRRSNLRAVLATVLLTDAAGTSEGRLEISLQATSQFTTNDAEGVLGHVAFSNDQRGKEVLIPVNADLDAGQRVYIHRNINTAPDSCTVNATLMLE